MMDLAAFEALLDGYGSDRARWPGLKRAAADNLVATDRNAQRLLAEAKALDQLLATVATNEPVSNEQALLDRILSKAAHTPRLTASGGASIPAATAIKPFVRATAQPTPLRRAPNQDLWRNTALIAASLILGVYVGQTQLSVYAIPALEDFANRTIGTETRNIDLAEAAIDVGDDE